ncbi:MAG: pyruvate kinase alpha/beta domain-containing protein [Methanobacteriaceae archaeon]
MEGTKNEILYFEKAGLTNTEYVIDVVKKKIEESNISTVAIASASGATALDLIGELSGMDVKVINVTHHAGFHEKNKLDIDGDVRAKLEDLGVETFVGGHGLSGACRGITKKYGGFTPLDIMADTFRLFSHGIKVGVEISIMLADAGLVSVDEEIIAIGGRASGIDSAIVLTPANMNSVFDLKIHEILAMPRP